jgi:ABC-2 type transport system ATP-binding protein
MGKTILISSHILSELAELCTAVGIIEQGRLVYAGKISDMLAKAGTGGTVHVVVDERPEDAAALLQKVKGIVKVSLEREDRITRIDVSIDPRAGLVVSDIPSRLITQGFRVARFSHEPITLEAAFMRLTKGIVS